MATYDLEEQEQISELKAWWQQYGNLVTTLVTVAALAIVSWQGWNWYQRNQSAQASVLFSVVQKAAAENDAKRARDVTGELINSYSGTVYAVLGALTSAKLQYESGDTKTARAQLQWAADKARDDNMRAVARLRLAAVLLDEMAYDEANKLLEKPPANAFAARFHELHGDVLVAQGKRADARVSYQAALGQLDAGDGNKGRETQLARRIVQTKLDALGDGK